MSEWNESWDHQAVATSLSHSQLDLFWILDPIGAGTQYDDRGGRLRKMITSGSNTTTWNYSASGWLTGKRDHADKGADFTWTNGGKLQSREWQRVISGTSTRVKTTWNYHAHTGELASVDHNDSTPDLVYSYDCLGRSSQVTQAGHSWVYAYDPSTLRLDTETINYDTDGNGTADFTRVLDRSQDSLGRNNGWALKNGGTTQHSNTYTFDTAGRHATVTDGTDTFTYSYAANSSELISTVTSPNPGSPVRKVTNTWASNRDVLTVKQNQRSVSGTLVTASQYNYTVDNLPRRTDLSFSGDAFAASGSIAWAYNTSGEVQSANHSVNTSDRYFLYDTLGNRIRARDGVTTDSGGTLTSYTTNTLNQYSALSGAVSVSPTYDLDGNQLTGVLPVNPGIASGYTWNANNELSVVKSGSPLTTLATYQYDPFGRRIMRDTASAKTWFIYDGWNLIAEYSNVLALTHAHTWGLDLSGSLQGAGGVGGLLSTRIFGNGFYPLYDGNGNITQYVNSSGTISAHYEYDPFGRITFSTSSTTFNFRFSSKYYDTQTGLSYYGFRYYDPLVGRWLGRDPVTEFGGRNLYCFISNNGISRLDYLGLCEPNTYQLLEYSVVTRSEEVESENAAIKKQLKKLAEAVDNIKKTNDLVNPVGGLSRNAGRSVGRRIADAAVDSTANQTRDGGADASDAVQPIIEVLDIVTPEAGKNRWVYVTLKFKVCCYGVWRNCWKNGESTFGPYGLGEPGAKGGVALGEFTVLTDENISEAVALAEKELADRVTKGEFCAKK